MSHPGNGDWKDYHGGVQAGGGAVVQIEGTNKHLFVIAIFAVAAALLACLLAGYAWVDAARSSERADQAERSAAISRLYSVQVYTELNRLGYPVKTPAELDHQLQPEDE